jgi:hypothetical protein
MASWLTVVSSAPGAAVVPALRFDSTPPADIVSRSV